MITMMMVPINEERYNGQKGIKRSEHLKRISNWYEKNGGREYVYKEFNCNNY